MTKTVERNEEKFELVDFKVAKKANAGLAYPSIPVSTDNLPRVIKFIGADIVRNWLQQKINAFAQSILVNPNVSKTETTTLPSGEDKITVIETNWDMFVELFNKFSAATGISIATLKERQDYLTEQIQTFLKALQSKNPTDVVQAQLELAKILAELGEIKVAIAERSAIYEERAKTRKPRTVKVATSAEELEEADEAEEEAD